MWLMVIGVSHGDLKIAYESYAMGAFTDSARLGSALVMAETATTPRGNGRAPESPTDLSKRTWTGTSSGPSASSGRTS